MVLLPAESQDIPLLMPSSEQDRIDDKDSEQARRMKDRESKTKREPVERATSQNEDSLMQQQSHYNNLHQSVPNKSPEEIREQPNASFSGDRIKEMQQPNSPGDAFLAPALVPSMRMMDKLDRTSIPCDPSDRPTTDHGTSTAPTFAEKSNSRIFNQKPLCSEEPEPTRQSDPPLRDIQRDERSFHSSLPDNITQTQRNFTSHESGSQRNEMILQKSPFRDSESIHKPMQKDFHKERQEIFSQQIEQRKHLHSLPEGMQSITLEDANSFLQNNPHKLYAKEDPNRSINAKIVMSAMVNDMRKGNPNIS